MRVEKLRRGASFCVGLKLGFDENNINKRLKVSAIDKNQVFQSVNNRIPFYLITKCDMIYSISKGDSYGRKDISE